MGFDMAIIARAKIEKSLNDTYMMPSTKIAQAVLPHQTKWPAKQKIGFSNKNL